MNIQEELDKLLTYQEDDLLVFTTMPQENLPAYKRIGEFKYFTACEVNGKSMPGIVLKYLGNEIKIPITSEGEIRKAYATEEILWKLQNEDGDIKTTDYNHVFNVV